MLAELWAYLTTPCSPAARRLGYLRESIALAARRRRCRVAWQNHLDNSRRALLAAGDACRQRRTALIFGSGHLFDVPLAELAGRFRQVLLVDVLHPQRAKRQARAFANVALLEHDLTECADAMLHAPGATIDAPTLAAWGQRRPRRFLDDENIDFVVSLNLLSQLPLALSAWLLRRKPPLPEAAVEAFALETMRRHLEYLSAFDASVCLIADAEQLSYDANHRLLVSTDYAGYFQLDRWACESWWWDIAPPGELSGGVHARHRVVACRLGGLSDKMAENRSHLP